LGGVGAVLSSDGSCNCCCCWGLPSMNCLHHHTVSPTAQRDRSQQTDRVPACLDHS
jgi:hypothetical protein